MECRSGSVRRFRAIQGKDGLCGRKTDIPAAKAQLGSGLASSKTSGNAS
ncbi:hypothetical protein ACFSQ7_04930 [Paenibacillus rhizoplanae]